jgi:tetratricopeptide (TPR) repeat protein
VGRNDDALAVLQKGVAQVTPQSDKKLMSDFYTFIGDLLHTANRMTECYEAYDSALVYNPDNIGVLNNYAYFLSLTRENLDKAEEMSYRTIKAEPDNKTYLDTYAWILFQQGKFADAQRYMDRVVPRDSTEEFLMKDEHTTSAILEHAADVAWMNGDAQWAIRLWQLAVKRGDADATPMLNKKARKKKYYPLKK